ncbi:MAG: TlpA family protein disulfide reductase [Rubrivivax sp.]|nr:TlpA family protein disulfide reductase [Rubrivivax sp.]
MNRRGLALVSVATLAAAAGGVWRWRQEAAQGELASVPESAPGADAGVRASAAFSLWDQQVERLDGSTLALSSLRGRRLLVNFWATWCPPCVREMPLFEQFHREHGGAANARAWQVLGLAIDRREAVAAFLQRQPVSYPIGLAGLDGTQWSRELGNDKGGLPFTVAFDAQGRVLQRKLGEISEMELKAWAAL